MKLMVIDSNGLEHIHKEVEEQVVVSNFLMVLGVNNKLIASYRQDFVLRTEVIKED